MKLRHLIIPAAIVAFAATASCTTKPVSAIPARISFISGTVLVNGKDAALGQTVVHGDVIETRAMSSCRVIVDDKNILALQDDCTMVYRIRQEDPLLDLKKGVLAVIVKNRKNIDNLRVNTPTMTAGVRGTVFVLGAEGPDKVYTCLCNGVIHYHPEGHAKSERYAAAHHKGVYFNRSGGIVTAEPGGMKYHTDEDIEKLASDINVRVDWTKIEE